MMTKIQQYLLNHADQQYRDFTLPLIPNVDPKSFIGVRLPIIKKFAKDLSEEERLSFLEELPHQYHEENILHALILSNMKDYDTFVHRVDAFLPYISNWAVTDSICNKHMDKHKEKLIHEVYRWMESDEPYAIRFAFKCLMNYYLGDDHKDEFLEKATTIHVDDYYVNMMIAWYLATGLAKNYDHFIKAIEGYRFDTFIHNKAIQKAVESYRVSDEHKTYLKTLKIK